MQSNEKLKAEMALMVTMTAALRPTVADAVNAVEKAAAELGYDLDSPALTAHNLAAIVDFAANVVLDPQLLLV